MKKKTIRFIVDRTDEECKALGMPTKFEMMSQGIYFGPNTQNMYLKVENIEIEVPDDHTGTISKKYLKEYLKDRPEDLKKLRLG